MKEKNTVFYKCPVCNNLIGLIQGDAQHITCCGKPMELLVANSVDAATEKHVPVYEKDGDEMVVRVGEVSHPMDEDHYIMWIAVVSDNQTTRVRFYPNQEPVARFKYIPGSIIYAYCNKHGLWKNEVK